MSIFIFVGTALVCLGVDLLTKYLAFSVEQTRLLDEVVNVDGRFEVIGADEREVRLVPGLLHLRAMTNQGAIFGIGQGNVPMFIVVSIAAVGFLGFLFLRTGKRWGEQLLLGLLLAGVSGNLYDRIVYGYVRDMLFALPGWHWPGEWVLPFLNYPGGDRLVFPYIFNFADMFLVGGVLTLLLLSLLPTGKPAKPRECE